MDIDLEEHNKLREEVVAHAYSVVNYKVLHTTRDSIKYPTDILEKMFRKTEEALYVVAGGKAALMRRCEQLAVEKECLLDKIEQMEAVRNV